MLSYIFEVAWPFGDDGSVDRSTNDARRLHPTILQNQSDAKRNKALSRLHEETLAIGQIRNEVLTYPFHGAIEAGNVPLALSLLRDGADPAEKDRSGRTPLAIAESTNRNGSQAKLIAALNRALEKRPQYRLAR
eukprot:TRINITY_DN93032_c0_g1_i1.p1 TRINITY_DN93032_c0_g1~~TRINITY_DN93032_c0_g1_i1.p1  ORF type:complete len:151 (-),score=15.21 TRINITY_DN93032_c0_g1_i1:143-544(-)